jgi:peptide/nickel transport system substrate-binding protein
MKTRKLQSRYFLLACALGLSACQESNKSPPDTLTTIVANPVQSLNPLYSTDAASQRINELIHSALVSLNDQLVPEPYLAESIKLIDPLTIEFKLREGCRFANGRPITTNDVEQSLLFFNHPENKSAFLETFKLITKFQRIDDLRFRLVTAKPAPGLITDLDLLKILDLSTVKPGEKLSSLPGAGPFKLVSLSAAEIRLNRQIQPCLPTPPLDKIVIKVVRDDLSRFLKLKTGEIDLVLNEMNYRKVELIENDPSLPMVVKKADGIGYSYLGLNLVAPHLQDVRVRRAIALSLDVPSLIKYKSRGMASPARNLLADNNFFANLEVPVVQRDLEEARRLLGDAGYNNGRNGKPPLQLTLKTNTNTISVENARVIVAQAKEAGIELKHLAHDWGIFYNDVKTGNTEIYSLRWVGVTDPRIYFEAFHSGEFGRNNRTRYRNPELDLLLEKGESLLDPAARKKVYAEVQALVARDLPYIGLWYGNNVAVFRKELKNVSLHPSGKWLPILSMSKE